MAEGQGCSLKQRLSAISDEGLAALALDLLNDREASSIKLGHALTAHGIKATPRIIQRHRQKECACENGTVIKPPPAPTVNVGILRQSLEELRTHSEVESNSIGKLANLLRRSGIDPDDVGKVTSIRLNEYQGFYKDDNNEAQVVDLEAAQIVLHPKWAEGPEWPVVQPAKPTIIRPSKVHTGPRAGWQTAFVIPDTQFGYLRELTNPNVMSPFHDEAALAVTLALVRTYQPTLIILLGDFLDLPEFSRFVKEPGFALTTQASLNRAHEFLGQLRAASPNAEIRLLEGNHDRRLENYVKTNAAAAHGIQVANAPKSWPVLSIPNLLRLDDVGVEYVGGYPAGITWINDNLACIHGSKVRSSGSTAAAVIDDERVSVIFGHIHRIERTFKTRRIRSGQRVNFAASPGCQCRIDGVVPSTKGAYDPFGNPMTSYENWQQGLAVVTYEEGDGRFDYEQVFIHEGAAIFRGLEFLSHEVS